MSSAELTSLVSASSIQDVRFFKVEGSFDVDSVSADGAADADEEVSFGISMSARGDDAGLIATMTCTVERPGIRYLVEVAGLYDVDDWSDDKFADATVREFGNRVAMYQLLPFAREGIADLATRLRLPVPILPLLPQHLGPGDLAPDDDHNE